MTTTTTSSTRPTTVETLTQISVEPWPDPVIDQLGHDPRSAYAEKFWLGILGPSTLWLLRRIADGFDNHPEGFALDFVETARSIGVGMRGGKNSPFIRSLRRSERFGIAQFHGNETFIVRRKIPPLNRRQVENLPEALRVEHTRWIERPPEHTPAQRKERARRLALSLLQIGEDRNDVERQLHRWQFHPALAHDALRWALSQQPDHHSAAETFEPTQAAIERHNRSHPL